MDDHGPDAPEAQGAEESLTRGGILRHPLPPISNKIEGNQFDNSQHPVIHITSERKYLPTLPELIDRLAITQLKAIFIPEHAEAYRAEMALIMHDVDLILAEQPKLDAEAVRAILILMLANRFIWENESKARAGGPEQDKLLKLTHSINGVRNQAKNVIAAKTGGRKDFKTDSLAADLPAEFGHWDVFR